MHQPKKILVTGGAGFLGSYVVEALRARWGQDIEVFIPERPQDDLRDMATCERLVSGMDTVIHLAARVGGIGFNQQYPGTLFYDNAIMGIQLLEAARKANVQKVVVVGTVCPYPKILPVPFKEDDIWLGYPEETNAPYGLAKKMILVQAQAYRKQYGLNAIYLLPVNLYGPRDDFDPSSSHVIPALIKKVIDAKRRGDTAIDVWGTGSASREFCYAKDTARGIVLATELYDVAEPVNLGSGMEITIKELIETIKRIAGYDGEIRWDASKPDGQPRRCLDVSRAKKEFGFTAEVPFEQGLRETIEWYIQQQST